MKYQKTKTIGHNHIRICAAHKQGHLLAYIDLRIAFSGIDHPWLLATMEDMAYPKDLTIHPKLTKKNPKPSSHLTNTKPYTRQLQMCWYTYWNSLNHITHPLSHAQCGSININVWIRVAHATNHNTTREPIHWARVVVKVDTNVLIVLIVKHKDLSPQQIPLRIHKDIHTLLTIPPPLLHLCTNATMAKILSTNKTILNIHDLQTQPTKPMGHTQVAQRTQGHHTWSIQNPKWHVLNQANSYRSTC